MARKYFNFSDVLSYGWGVMKTNLWFFVGLGFVFLVVIYLPTIARVALKTLNLPKASETTLAILLQVLGVVLNIIVKIGLIKIALSFCDEQKPPFATLFDAWDCFGRVIGTGILYGLIMLATFGSCVLAAALLVEIHFPWPLLLIIPTGIILGVRFAIQFSLCYYFVIDKALGPVQALKASSRTTMGAKWRLLGFGIVCALINLLGLFCLIVGIFATYPTVLVASALVYRQLLAQTPEPAEFGIGSSDIQPEGQSGTPPLQNWRGL